MNDAVKNELPSDEELNQFVEQEFMNISNTWDVSYMNIREAFELGVKSALKEFKNKG